MSANNINHFGKDSIKRSLKYFAIGKGTNVFISLLILFSLAKFLDETSYAAYVSWQALVVLIGLISTVGIQSVLQRYLAELRTQGNNIVLYRLLTVSFVLRYLSALGITLLVIYFIPKTADVMIISGANDLFALFLIIGSFRVTSLTISQAYDSLLWQRVSQISLVCANIFRVVMILLTHNYYGLTLETVVLIELGAELIFLSILLIGLFFIWKGDQQRSLGDITWWRENQTRLVRYGGSRFLANLCKFMYGGAPNRLLVAQYMPIREVAVFGFADNLLALTRRFAPAVLFIGFIRPVFVSKYTETKDFKYLVYLTDIIFRVNVILMMYLVVGLLVVGEPVMAILSGGKYGEVNFLLAGFFILLIIEGFRLNLELLIEVVELNSISITSNTVQSLSLFLAIPFFAHFGLWAIVIANVTGTLVASAICIVQLFRNGYRVNIDLKLNILIFVNAAITYWIGMWVYRVTESILITGAAISLIYVLCNVILRPLNQSELNQIKTFAARKKKNV